MSSSIRRTRVRPSSYVAPFLVFFLKKNSKRKGVKDFSPFPSFQKIHFSQNFKIPKPHPSISTVPLPHPPPTAAAHDHSDHAGRRTPTKSTVSASPSPTDSVSASLPHEHRRSPPTANQELQRRPTVDQSLSLTYP